MKAPQIIYIVLAFISLYVSAEHHGESKGNYNFWGSLIGSAIVAAILIWGGFFN